MAKVYEVDFQNKSLLFTFDIVDEHSRNAEIVKRITDHYKSALEDAMRICDDRVYLEYIARVTSQIAINLAD